MRSRERRAAQGDGAKPPQRTVLQLAGPFDLALSLEAAAIFYPREGPTPRALRVAVRTEAGPAILEATQLSQDPARLDVRLSCPRRAPQLRRLAGRLICAELDLRPFYRLTSGDPLLGPVTAALSGLKPLLPANVFEAAVIAITEQQLSMAAAYRIRTRLIRRLGQPVEDLWLFPGPDRLADTPASDLAACGLSRQKISYLKALARSLVAGDLDLESLRRSPDAEIRDRLGALPGFGRWSVEHVLLHGFGRPGGLPSTDVSLQQVVGRYLGGRGRMTAEQLAGTLSPFRPYDGLAAYYLSVAYRRQDRAGLSRGAGAKP